MSLIDVPVFGEIYSWNSSRSYEATGDVGKFYVSGDFTDLIAIFGYKESFWHALISLSLSEKPF